MLICGIMSEATPLPRASRMEAPFRVLAGVLFFGAGILHFVVPGKYEQIIPPGFPMPGMLVAISGMAEIVGGAGLLIRPLRRAAGWGLIALLIAVFPANIFMAIHPERIAGLHMAPWLLWTRLPLQGVLIAWVYTVSLSKKPIGPRHEILPS